ncbi:MAG: ABC transporter permease [Acidobacteriota bacterium]
MRKVAALVRASWLHVLSYRLQLVFTLMGLLVAVVPVYFVSNALQPMMAQSIHEQGSQYFAFLIVGMLTYGFIATAVGALHASLSSDISTGALEAVLSTPTPLPVLMMGMIGQAFTHTAFRSAVLLLAAWALGAQLVWSAALVSLAILALLVIAYTGLGIFAASLVLAFKTTGPVPSAILGVSALLGGVYYPTSVIPSWLQHLSALLPLTYGLRALRQSLLHGAPLSTLASDVSILTAFAVVLLGSSLIVFSGALKYAKKQGTLAHY